MRIIYNTFFIAITILAMLFLGSYVDTYSAAAKERGARIGKLDCIEGEFAQFNGEKWVCSEPPMRKIQYATGLGDPDSRDEGLVNGRILDFNKTYNDTVIRISYTDNFRVIGESPFGKGCSWEIQVDGDSCPSGKLVYNYFAVLTDSNQLRSHTVVGYCEGLSVGMHKVTVLVTPLRVDSDCFTGFGFEPEPSRWVIEVEEVN